ncbi:hypothetical protein AAG906_004417 [Vitis piasezkii]
MVKEVETVITLRSGKEVDMPTSKLEHDEERMSKEVKEGSWESRGAQKQGESMACKISQPKVTCCENCPLAVKWFRSLLAPSAKIFAAAKRPLGTRVPFRKPVHPFRSCEMAAKPPRLEILHFAAETPFGRVFRSCETTLWHTSAISQPRTLISQLRNALNGAQFGVETKKLWPFEDDCAKLNGNVAAAPHFTTIGHVLDRTPFRRVFRSCETTLWHTSATSQRRTPISQLRKSLLYKILPPLRKRSPSFKNGMRSSFLCFFFPFDYQMDTK